MTLDSVLSCTQATPRPTLGTGTEWIVDADGCDPQLLSCLQTMSTLCDDIAADLGLNVVGLPHWHQFPGPAGVTGLYLLSESHLACHTYPELQCATFNLYCCRERSEWPWILELSRRLSAARVRLRRVDRGTLLDTTEGQA